MATITLKGNPIHTVGDLPKVGASAPAFTLTNGKLEDISLATFGRQIKILNIVPSLDTGTCAASARRFNVEAAKLANAVILTISADLPFAMGRFCAAEGIDKVVPLSSFRSPRFGKDYGVEITDGPIRGLLSRSVVVLNADNKVTYTQQVAETADEPNYDAALQAIRRG